jgi:hypothetical protein
VLGLQILVAAWVPFCLSSRVQEQCWQQLRGHALHTHGTGATLRLVGLMQMQLVLIIYAWLHCFFCGISSTIQPAADPRGCINKVFSVWVEGPSR